MYCRVLPCLRLVAGPFVEQRAQVERSPPAIRRAEIDPHAVVELEQAVVRAEQGVFTAGARRHTERGFAPGHALVERVCGDHQVVDVRAGVSHGAPPGSQRHLAGDAGHAGAADPDRAVGIAVEVSTLWIPSDLKYASALVVLIVILLVRPQGLLGRRERLG